MKFTLELPIKKNDVIYTVEDCKIEKYYVESVEFFQLPEHRIDISGCIKVHLERYKEPQNSFTTTKLLSHCFLSKEELISQL